MISEEKKHLSEPKPSKGQKIVSYGLVRTRIGKHEAFRKKMNMFRFVPLIYSVYLRLNNRPYVSMNLNPVLKFYVK